MTNPIISLCHRAIYGIFSSSNYVSKAFQGMCAGTLKRPLLSLAVLLSCLSFCAPDAAAQEENPRSGPDKTVLILNSYNENSSWSKSVIEPVNLLIAQREDVHAEIMHLNSTLITDSATYEKVHQSVLNNCEGKKIDYVVYVGNLAFSMRDDLRKLYGEDLPMLLITRDLSSAPLYYYFSDTNLPSDFSSLPSLGELRPEVNFTAVYVPDFYKSTVDMMMKLIPDMEEFVYFSDAVYFNRYLSSEVEKYIMTEYPNVTFKWAVASHDNAELLPYYLVKRKPNVGLLLSSWFYEIIGSLGYPSLTSGEMSLLSSSINPVFSLRQSYMEIGAVGGVYADIDKIKKAITRDIEAMFAGESMRDINFYIDRESKVPMINYPLIKEYKLSTSACPKGTLYVNKPLSFWEKYHWQALVCLLILIGIFYLLLRRNMVQRHDIENLSRHKQFVDNMPIPYTKAKVIYNEYMNAILNIKYTMSNQAFDILIRENSDQRNPYLLFSPEFISEKTTEMLDTDKPVSFLQHFEKSDKYYEFTLCLVDSMRGKSKDVVDTIDIFAIDVTSRQKSEDRLKKLTKRLDMTIDVANIIPWEWDPVKDIMIFDAYSMFQRLKRSFDDSHMDNGESRINTSEFMKLIYPEDREKVRKWREELLLGKADDFQMQYRLVIARQNQEKVEWVDVRGAVVEKDSEGKPLKVMGSMIVITDRKHQEAAMLDAQRKSNQAELLRSEFVNNLSHEVRIQLNAIVGFAGLMYETEDQDKRKEFADIINTNTAQLLDYIDQIVADSSPTPKKSRLVESSVNLKSEGTKPVVKTITSSGDVKTEKKAQDAPAYTPAVNVPDSPKPETKDVPLRSNHRKLILIAEDIEGNFLLLKHYIPKNYDIVHAWTGKEAVEMFNKYNPDIVLMDIGMPVMDGYKATAEIRKVNLEVPIVAVTAYTSNSERELILSSGFDDYIPKPVMRDTIIDALNHYL